jgi:hypothetical protein
MSRSRIQLATSLVAAAGLGVMANAPTSSTIRPGYWSTTNTVSSPIHQSKTENRCVTQEAIAKFTGCYINHHYKCTCPEESNANGRIIFHGDCVDAKGSHVLIDGEGVYTPTTLQMTAHGRARVLGISVPFSTATDSHWLADACPPGSPGSDGR